MRMLSLALATSILAGRAPTQDQATPDLTPAQMLAEFHPAEGTAKLSTMGEVKLPPGWLFLGGEDGRQFLRKIGNQPGPSTLGVAIPPDFAESDIFAVYSYADEGHVDDAETPDYDALLADMKEGTAEESKQRMAAGLEGVEVLGWAESPHYDRSQHKLFWALRLRFGESATATLNYNVRVLGRTGYLVVNGVGGIEQLPLVAEHSKSLLQVTEFVAGQRYENFDPEYDKVAAYGIGGLIAGGMAMKLGLFAKLAVMLKVFLKPILVGVFVLGALLWKVFTGRKPSDKVEAPAA